LYTVLDIILWDNPVLSAHLNTKHLFFSSALASDKTCMTPLPKCLVDYQHFSKTLRKVSKTTTNTYNYEIRKGVFEAIVATTKDANYYIAMHSAIKHGLIEFVSYMLRAHPILTHKLDEFVGWASIGRKSIANMLLQWPINTPRADHDDGNHLVWAARYGHPSIVRMLLQWPDHAPRADCQEGTALLAAAMHGHTEIVRMLLECPCNAPRADHRNGAILLEAAMHGHMDIVHMLLEWPSNAPLRTHIT
jgi:ankyrin repeat protein